MTLESGKMRAKGEPHVIMQSKGGQTEREGQGRRQSEMKDAKGN
jgi:hypothetical protein